MGCIEAFKILFSPSVEVLLGTTDVEMLSSARDQSLTLFLAKET